MHTNYILCTTSHGHGILKRGLRYYASLDPDSTRVATVSYNGDSPSWGSEENVDTSDDSSEHEDTFPSC
jgi:hypothetical protein